MNEILINASPRVTVDEDYGRIIVRPPTHVRKYPVSVTHTNEKSILVFKNLYGINTDEICLKEQTKVYKSIYSITPIKWDSITFIIESSTLTIELTGLARYNIKPMTYVDFPIKGQFNLLKNGHIINTDTLNLPDDEDYKYVDSIGLEQGVKYAYGLQQADMAAGISEVDAVANWEDILLSDKKGRVLRIRYNPKISSFKTVVLEQKIDTIEGTYPFFFRNGNISYKEIPISGLISYQVDELGLFDPEFAKNNSSLSRRGTADFGTSLVEKDEFYLERKYKRAVEDWLRNGEPKYLRTAAEGNFVVRLMNVSLTPNDQLGRRLHSFSATAYEIEDYPDTMLEYNPQDITTNFIRDDNAYIELGTVKHGIKKEGEEVAEPIQISNIAGLLIESFKITNEATEAVTIHKVSTYLKDDEGEAFITLAPGESYTYNVKNAKTIKFERLGARGEETANVRLRANYIGYTIGGGVS